MTKYTIFITPGELDLSAITTFGMNAKIGTNPIGFFGTGLKYAIAVLLREDIDITLYTGGSEYKFYTKNKDFRGKEFKTCRYRKSGLFNRFTYHDLPFTTELGKHWELWQAFRELMSNTLDESGHIDSQELDVEANFWKHSVSGYTYIVIEGQAFADVVAKGDEIFLPKDKLKLVAANNEIEVYEGISRYIYYRGLRAYDLKDYEKSSMYTYNYIGTDAKLTEDRTINSMFYVKWAIANLIVKSDDRKFIGTMMKPKDQFFEKDLDYNSQYSKSDTFNSVVYRIGSSAALQYMPSSARSYYTDVLDKSEEDSKSETLKIDDNIWEAIIDVRNETMTVSGEVMYREALEDFFNALAKKFDRGEKTF